MFKNQEGYEYIVISPEEIGNTISSVKLEEYYLNKPATNKRWEKMIQFMQSHFPELGEWTIAPHSRISTGKILIREFVEKLMVLEVINTLWGYIALDSYPFILIFPELPEGYQELGRWWKIPKVLLGLPNKNVIYHSEIPQSLQFSIDRTGHYAITNGDGAGWRYQVFTDGDTLCSIKREEENEDPHIEKYNVSVSISNASWVIVKSEYDDIVYRFDDKYDFYANPPLNWRKYLKESL